VRGHSQLLLRITATGVLTLSLLAPADAQLRKLVIGGASGTTWDAVADRVVGLETPAGEGSIQPQRLLPDQNIMVGPRTDLDELTNVFGHKWAMKKVGRGADFELGVSPRFWTATYSSIYHGGRRPLIDGDDSTVIKVIWVPQGARGRDQLYTFDFGFPMPINRVLFYAPDHGIDELGGLRKQRFPQAYEVSGALEPEDYLLVSEETSYHTLDKVLARTYNNSERVVDLRFPTQMLRFLRLSFNLISQHYLLAEIQAFGEGYAPTTSYRTLVVSLDEAVNFGAIRWHFETFSLADAEAEPVADPEAPVEMILQSRTGRDDTPKTYTTISEIMTRRIVDEATYNRAPETSVRLGPRPGDKGPILDDEENWSIWSTPYRAQGEQLRSPDGREYLQLQFRIESQDHLSFGRLDSISIEYSPMLAERLVGEVGLAGVTLDEDQVPTAPPGVDTNFVYDVRAEFGPLGDDGFDVLRVTTGAEASFVSLQIGEPLQTVVPDSTDYSDGVLSVNFASNPVRSASGSERLRLEFKTMLLNYSTSFLAEVDQVAGVNLAQSIDPGNASDLVGEDIRVFVDTESIPILLPVELSSSVITPNGDGINDVLEAEMTLLGVESSKTQAAIHDLAGRRLRALVDDDRGRGRSTLEWDGRDEAGKLVAPGVYLLRIEVETNAETVAETHTVQVVY